MPRIVMRSRSTLKWLLPLLLIHAACEPRHARVESVEFLEVPHMAGTNLPRWAACWFPHQANAGAVKRAHPCPAEAAATTIYTPRDVQGCWMLTGKDADPPYPSPFFSGPLRLDVATAPRLRDRGWNDAGSYRVEPLAHVPDRAAMDTALFATYWTFASPDSLSIIRSTGLTGVHLSFRVRGDSLVGMGRGFTDVIAMSTNTIPDPLTFIRGRRVACPRESARDGA